MAGTQQNSGSMYNSLTAGSKIVGTIVTDSNIRVDGTIEGDVKCAGKLVVGEKGVILGTIECENAEIMGTIEGKIVAKQSLALRATSRIKGEIYTLTLTVEPNAIFNGTCEMGKTTVQPNKK
ncbi:MAG: polymer-forming cytoskeletal protein [Paludibacteraceae bacterium]|nr:polymer-forming cytoskeletal protein [Paludibacteraceae bacterium]